MKSSEDRNFYFFHYQQATLHYSVSGNGPVPIFCFHGFGLTCKQFIEFEEKFFNQYTFYSFDLFYHGKSEWKSEEPLTMEFLGLLFSEFCKINRIQSFALLGYSIGARSVWALVNQMSEKVEEIIAIAPDGITNSFWFSLATGSSITRRIFKKVLENKSYVQLFLATGGALRIIPAVTIRFAKCQLRTQAQRKKVYATWLLYRLLKPSAESLAFHINDNSIKTTLYLGDYDKIISKHTIRPLTKKLNKANVITLKAGHLNLIHAVCAMEK